MHLSNPDGCPPNTNYSVGEDVEVTIAASDAAPNPTVAPVEISTTAVPPVTPAPAEGTLPGAIEEEDDDGVSSGAIVAAIIVALAAATAGFVMWRRRQLQDRVSVRGAL